MNGVAGSGNGKKRNYNQEIMIVKLKKIIENLQKWGICLNYTELRYGSFIRVLLFFKQ